MLCHARQYATCSKGWMSLPNCPPTSLGSDSAATFSGRGGGMMWVALLELTEQAVAALDHVDEGVHVGAGHVVDRAPRVLQRHGRLHREQV